MLGGGGATGAGANVGITTGSSFASPRAPFMGGGGGSSGGGGSNGNGNSNGQNQTQFQDQNQDQNGDQNQDQNQDQNGGGNGDTPGNVVPEPAAIALALLGMPALYAAMRRRKKLAAAS
jgi:hypothetical protein